MLQWKYYQPTELENRIIVLYRSIGIETVDDLQEELIAARLGIKLRYEDAPSFSFEKGNFRCIVIDKNLERYEQRRHFFHELGHLFRGHTGNQAAFPDLFMGLLEEQAEHFAKYAMMPCYMIGRMLLPNYERDIISLFSEEFRVTYEMAARRLDQIKNRIYYGQAREQFLDKIRTQCRTTEPKQYTAETLRLLEQLKDQTALKEE